jgi:hypothetical protein
VLGIRFCDWKYMGFVLARVKSTTPLKSLRISSIDEQKE